MLRSFFEVFVVVYQPCLYHTRSCIEILPRKCGESVTNSSQRLCYTMNTHPVADRTAPHWLDSMIYYLTNGGAVHGSGRFRFCFGDCCRSEALYSSSSFARRESASSSVSFSRAKCRRIRLPTGSRKKLEPGNSMYTVYRIHFESSSIKYAKIEMHRNITL